MPQNIQLDQPVIHGMEVEVSGDDPLLHLIRRVVDGGEHIDVLILGDDNDARRVLPRSDLYVQAALAQPVYLRPAEMTPCAVHVVHNALIGLLFRYTGNGARPIGVVLAEHLLHILVGPVLILPGKVQIDIGGLIALKAQKDFKGDLIPALAVGCAADRAELVRQVHPAGIQAGIHVKLAVSALGAHIVGGQGVHLGDPRHGGHKAAAYAAPGPYQISVGIAFVHQPLRHKIQRGKVGYRSSLEVFLIKNYFTIL